MRTSTLTLARLALVVSSAALIGACARSDDVAVSDTLVGDTTVVPNMEAGTVSKEYSDSELFGLIDLVNDGSIEVSKLAQTKATNAEVKAFARKIVTEHTALNKETAAMASKMNLTLAIPENDEDIAESHVDGMKDLTDKPRGEEFDEGYIEHEIKMHKTIIDEVKDALERPNQNAETQAFLQKALTAFEAHLQAAETIEKKFGV
ncbi:MAG: DUF4142 domain-containing protein [Gemmatimonadota bacterium]|nr:DUF4142 domain-containing protein [Gemmatimonadota bacterium]